MNADTVFPVSRNWYSRFLATVGRLDDALEQAQLAYEQAPDSATIISRLAISNLWVNDLAAAGRYFDIANRHGQESPLHDLAYALYLVRIEDIAASRRFAKTGLEKNGFDSSWVDPVYDGIEDRALRTRSVALMTDVEADDGLPKYIVMALWALLGETDRAFATAMSIEGIGQDFETGLEVIFLDDLSIVRAHSDFEQLLEAKGLADYWSQVGCVWADDRVACD
jgi:tetratricopeptide (TPR) repeat protein